MCSNILPVLEQGIIINLINEYHSSTIKGYKMFVMSTSYKIFVMSTSYRINELRIDHNSRALLQWFGYYFS